MGFRGPFIAVPGIRMALAACRASAFTPCSISLDPVDLKILIIFSSLSDPVSQSRTNFLIVLNIFLVLLNSDQVWMAHVSLPLLYLHFHTHT